MSLFYFVREIELLIEMNYPDKDYFFNSSLGIYMEDIHQPEPNYKKITKHIHKLLNNRTIRRYIINFRDFNIKFRDLYINLIDTIYNCCNLLI